MSEELMPLELIASYEKEAIYNAEPGDEFEIKELCNTARAAHRLQGEVERLKVDLLCAKELNKKYEQLVKVCNGLSDRLQGENEELRKELTSANSRLHELAVYIAEIEALRKDAERYRFLRGRLCARVTEAASGSKRMAITTRVGHAFLDTRDSDSEHHVKMSVELDKTIDAAMKSGGDGE